MSARARRNGHTASDLGLRLVRPGHTAQLGEPDPDVGAEMADLLRLIGQLQPSEVATARRLIIAILPDQPTRDIRRD